MKQMLTSMRKRKCCACVREETIPFLLLGPLDCTVLRKHWALQMNGVRKFREPVSLHRHESWTVQIS